MFMNEEFYYDNEGSISFVIPFLFTSDETGSENICTKLFGEIKPGSLQCKYNKQKEKLINSIIREFPNATEIYEGSIAKEKGQCAYYCRQKKLGGRNLCYCLSVSRKFHDDKSHNIPRLEISLGTYHVHYGISEKKVCFDFCFDTLLLLSNEDGAECGYLVLNISLKSIKEKGFGLKNSLDNIIFLKHLFYKSSLKCDIDDKRDISIQNWTDQYVRCLLDALGIFRHDRALGKDVLNDDEKCVIGAAFRYSILEINNIVDSAGKPILLWDIKDKLRKYQRQLYGLMVSDEGWRFLSDKIVQRRFARNNWASRGFMMTIFLGHSALIINQYNDEEHNSHDDYSVKWYNNYLQSEENYYYPEYIKLRPCIPGIASLTFFSFLNAISKELKLEKANDISISKGLSEEEKYKKLTSALQKHSMSLDEIHTVDDCVCAQFGIPTAIKELQERYQREANNVQNKKVVNLTHVTAIISIVAYLVAAFAISVTDSFVAHSLKESIYILFFIMLLPIITYSFLVFRLGDRIKKFIGRNELFI